MAVFRSSVYQEAGGTRLTMNQDVERGVWVGIGKVERREQTRCGRRKDGEGESKGSATGQGSSEEQKC